MSKRFLPGDRIRISEDFHWARGATGTVSPPPPQVTAISGPWDEGLTRRERTAVGEQIVYWIWFDEPQMDADGDGPYKGGSIVDQAIELIQPKPN
jgi:hypothetical protein